MSASAAALSRRERLIPPGAGPKDGAHEAPTKAVNFRCPVDLLEYIDAASTDGNSRTAVITYALNFYRSFVEEMGDEWWEVMRRAAIEKARPGEVAARLAFKALSGKSKK